MYSETFIHGQTPLVQQTSQCASMSVSIASLSFEHHRPAFGIAETEPRISWRFEGTATNWEQTSYDVEISRGADGVPNVFNVNSTDSILVPWPDKPLGSAESATVRARAHGGQGQESTEWSDVFTVETGLLNPEDWAGAKPIAADRETEIDAPKQPVLFRKAFQVNSEITSARLYITALGLYEAEINGQRVGDHVLAPGYMSYHHRHVYDTYDVTELVKPGENAIGATVGEGWYAGRIGLQKRRNLYGDTLGLISLLVVTNADGSKQTIPSDPTWRAATGPIVTSEIYNGEFYNATNEIEGWSLPDFDSTSWLDTKELSPPVGKIVAPDGPPIRKLESVKPQKIFLSDSGKTVIDFGQNLVGWLKLKVDGPEGTNITLVHTEVMENGEVATRPLRTAKATDTIILSGKGPLNWEPKFTFHGFRYVQVTGWPNATKLDGDSISAVVVHSDMERVGYFECSHELLNKFHNNVIWSLKGNFLSVPTDCPQRDERLGWTGDAHAFMPTSNYLYETAGFWRGWLKDAWSEQADSPTFIPPIYIPDENTTGDKNMLQEQYAGAQSWIDKGIPRNEAGLWNRSTFQFADWLDPKAPADKPGDATTDTHLVSDAYLIEMTRLLSNISAALGKTEEAEKYASQRTDLISAFKSAWVEPYDSIIANVTQTALTLGIGFGIFDTEALRTEAASTLRKVIADNDFLVGTGFAGTQQLGFTLSSIDATTDFYKMLLQTKVPSWLYQVVMGGTTTWERWDSLLSNGSVNPGEMTSFNHYAFGSVADWIHQKIGGLAPAEPGWKKVLVAPEPGGDITQANSSYLSAYGWTKASWNVGEDGFHLSVSVPPNARAEVKLPGANGTVTEVGSGTHQFTVEGFKVLG
ncbi:glycoside hydrolase family 78 protein [Aaosphaeria arxii CBS 175.79]|uniref:alpha-L-rhamnosidase n=1 Tax=Aaosphaeria arxii CBS 175.79 TaxID=1450172 RepID=A0A6A5XF50_9PLEO|nr:glycoside hydrolase family 78 protein [Aaosphaeria arxii CBS 175.79]KAF2011563.1 glycoside hydrolase family 78 protein [Aaosphaeria arxii CBS 175.79]